MISPPVEFADGLRDAVARQERPPYDGATAGREINGLYQRYNNTDLLLQAAVRFEALRDGTGR